MKSKIKLTREIQKRRRNLHREFLENLSTSLLPELFSELGINDYVVKDKFIEPRSNPSTIEISPDLVVSYLAPDWNLLLLEAKSSGKRAARRNLDEELSHLKNFFGNNRGTALLYETLGKKIPFEVLQSCRMQSIGVYRTKHGGFMIYKTERLK